MRWGRAGDGRDDTSEVQRSPSWHLSSRSDAVPLNRPGMSGTAAQLAPRSMAALRRPVLARRVARDLSAMKAPLPGYLIDMVRREAPVADVVPQSTPVVAFGDPFVATVATLGINPSWREFLGGGQLLDGPSRRLSTLRSLGAKSLGSLTDAQVLQVVEDCARYFDSDRNPYRRWFNPLDRVLSAGVGASYYVGSACHLDLVQWATDPTWGELEDQTREQLLAEGLANLRALLTFGTTRLVLLNGRQVLRQVETVGLVKLSGCGTMPQGKRTCSLYAGEHDGVRYVGWSTNLQSSFGVSNEFKDRLAAWVASVA